MGHSVQKNPFFTGSSEIKFSAIKSNFNLSGGTRASEFLRETDVNLSDPGIPDATENSNIETSSGTEWRASHFRNSIKSYTLQQSGTDENLVLANLDWNSNLSKNVKKKYRVTGKIGGTSSGGYALTIDSVIYNLEVSVASGAYILGYGGAAGIKGSSQTTETAPSTVSASISVTLNTKSDINNSIGPLIRLNTTGVGPATIKMHAGMSDGTNDDGRPWRSIIFGGENGTQIVSVDPGGDSARRVEQDIDVPVIGGKSYSITPTDLYKPVANLVDYDKTCLDIPNGATVSGFSMRDRDNNACRGRCYINGITQGSYSKAIGAGSGTDGGHAISVNSSGNRVRIVEDGSNSIRGGGGGGGAGKDGVSGTGGFCDTYDEATATRISDTRCRSDNMSHKRAQEICSELGRSQYSFNNSSDCCDYRTYFYSTKGGQLGQVLVGTSRTVCVKWNTYVYCWSNYATVGGSGGQGGNGGRGRGYNWNQLDGSTNKPIAAPPLNTSGGPTSGIAGGGCGATSGTNGTLGGDGGPWNTAGKAGDTGTGGAAGQRIVGSNWTS